MSLSTDTFVETNKDRLLSELKDFLRIPSVSTLPEHVPDIQRAAEFVAASLRAAKMENVEVIKTAGHPLVYADWLHAPGKPTVLCYGHYDVQPPDPLDEWITPPFEPTVRDGNIYARGSADDKGQMYSHIKAMEALFAVNGKLPVNVKFLIEGEEEVSGAAIAKYVAENPAKLKSDVALVSDTELYAEGIPTLCIGLRGLIYTEIEARGPAKDLHSGMYGGAAPNAIFGLVEILAKLKDAQWPHPHPRHLRRRRAADAGRKTFLVHAAVRRKGIPQGRGRFDAAHRRAGIHGARTRMGAADAGSPRHRGRIHRARRQDRDPRESDRQGQHPAGAQSRSGKMIAAYKKAVKDFTPAGIQTEVKILAYGPAISVNPDNHAIRVAAKAFSDVLGRETVFIRSGGSIPIVGDFAKHLGIPTILMGFGLPDDGLHSPNEKYKLANYYAGIMTIAHFLEQYGQ